MADQLNPSGGTDPEQASESRPGLNRDLSEPAPIRIVELDFAPLLALAEQVLPDAIRLAKWAEGAPLDHATHDLRWLVAKKWATLESALIPNGMGGGSTSIVYYAHEMELGSLRELAFMCLHALAADVRKYADWAEYLPERTDRVQPALDSGCRTVMTYEAFSRKLAAAIEVVREVVATHGTARPKITAQEANEKALRLAEADCYFLYKSSREWADAIGCSAALVNKLPLWKERMKLLRGDSAGRSTPRVVSFSDELEAATRKGEGRDQAQLRRLIAEQEADGEPSPLEPDPPDSPRKVRYRKQL